MPIINFGFHPALTCTRYDIYKFWLIDNPTLPPPEIWKALVRFGQEQEEQRLKNDPQSLQDAVSRRFDAQTIPKA